MLILALLLCAYPSASETTGQPRIIKLSGAQDGLYAKADYLVDLLLVVEKGKTLTFAPGSVIRLDKYGEIRVYGTLVCQGTASENIVFLSNATDAKGVPLPFGWNGIVLEDSTSRVVFENVRISNSTFGLKVAKRRASANLKDVWFSDNALANLSVGDSTMDVKQNCAYSITWPSEPPQGAAAADRHPLPFSTTAYIKQQHKSTREPWRVPVRVSLGALTVAGAGMIVAGQLLAVDAQQEYNTQSNRGDPFEQTLKRRDSSILLRNIGIPCLVLGALNLTLTFVY